MGYIQIQPSKIINNIVTVVNDPLISSKLFVSWDVKDFSIDCNYCRILHYTVQFISQATVIEWNTNYMCHIQEQEDSLKIYLNRDVYLEIKDMCLDAFLKLNTDNNEHKDVQLHSNLKDKLIFEEMQVYSYNRTLNKQYTLRSLAVHEDNYYEFFDRTFYRYGRSDYITKQGKAVVSWFIDSNIRIKATSMSIEKTRPYTLIYPDFENCDFCISISIEACARLCMNQLTNTGIVNFIYDEEKEQLEIMLNSIFRINLFDIDSEEFEKYNNYLRTQRVEENKRIKRRQEEAEFYDSDYSLSPNDPDYEFSMAEALDNLYDR